jgi:hypothetical protein
VGFGCWADKTWRKPNSRPFLMCFDRSTGPDKKPQTQPGKGLKKTEVVNSWWGFKYTSDPIHLKYKCPQLRCIVVDGVLALMGCQRFRFFVSQDFSGNRRELIDLSFTCGAQSH